MSDASLTSCQKVMAWLSEREREVCGACGARAWVRLATVGAALCLNCGSSSVAPQIATASH